jgi:hypothetical protein
VREWFPKSTLTDICRDTQKGDVAHLKVSKWDDYQQYNPVEVVGIVFPKYIKDKELTIYQLNQLEAFETLSKNAFNYGILGETAFSAVGSLVSKAALFEIEYGSLVDVEAFLLEEMIK